MGHRHRRGGGDALPRADERAAHPVPADPSVPRPSADDAGGADALRSGRRAPADPRRPTPDPPRARGGGWRLHATAAGCAPRAAAVQHLAAGNVCRGHPPARRRGALRRHRAHRARADARVRDPARARRPCGGAAHARGAPGHAPGALGVRTGDRRLSRRHARAAEHALRSEPHRPRHVRGGGRRDPRHRRARLLPPRAPRQQGRSGARATDDQASPKAKASTAAPDRRADQSAHSL